MDSGQYTIFLSVCHDEYRFTEPCHAARLTVSHEHSESIPKYFFIFFYLYCPFIYLHCPFYTLGITTNAPTVALCGYATAEREQLVWALWSVCFDRCVGFLASAIGFVVTSVKRNCERKRKRKKKRTRRILILRYFIAHGPEKRILWNIILPYEIDTKIDNWIFFYSMPSWLNLVSTIPAYLPIHSPIAFSSFVLTRRCLSLEMPNVKNL